MTRSLQEISRFLDARLIGDAAAGISGIASIRSAGAGDLVFVEDEKNLSSALASRAAAVLAGEFAAGVSSTKPLLIAKQPRLAFARAAKLLLPSPKPQAGIHPGAIVHASASLAKDVSVAERAVVGENASIGEGTRIDAGCVIGANVRIGTHCEIYPNVTIYPGAQLGNRVIVHAGAVLGSDGFGYVRDSTTGRYEKFPQIGRLEIEDDVEIGANATVDRGALDLTRICRGTKIDNLVHIGHNSQIGEDVVIAAQTGISGSVVIEKNAVLGGQVGVADRVRISEGVIVGAQTGIPSHKILRGKGIVFWGTPARPIQEYLKQLAVLAKLTKKQSH